jgi:tRNA-dependent cyclodipeptide synthase
MPSASLGKRARIRGQKWLAHDCVTLGISVGKPAHESDNLAAAVDMINSTRKPCVIRLSDTLQRHNFMALGMGAEEARLKAKIAGDEWLARNRLIIDQLALLRAIVRWDDVLQDADYDETYSAFVSLSKTNALFAEALQRDVERFTSRRVFRSHEEKTLAMECSRAFLLEEITGQTILARRYAYARFYPGKPAEILEIIRDQKVPDAPKGLEKTAFIRFRLESRSNCPPPDTDEFRSVINALYKGQKTMAAYKETATHEAHAFRDDLFASAA